MPIIETIFRAAHSLKGAARAVNFSEIERVCQSLEEPVRRLEARRDACPTPARSIRRTGRWTGCRRRSRCRRPQPIARALVSAAACSTPAQPVADSAAAQLSACRPLHHAAETETVRIAVSTLDTRLQEAEEMLTAKLAASQRAADLARSPASSSSGARNGRARSRRRARLRQTAAPDLGGLAEFFDWNHDYVRALESKVTDAAAHRRAGSRSWSASWWTTCWRIPRSCWCCRSRRSARCCRKWCATCRRNQGKEAELVIRGEEVEIDKRILEEMKDPLIHLLRNSHRPRHRDARANGASAGKPPRATIDRSPSRRVERQPGRAAASATMARASTSRK